MEIIGVGYGKEINIGESYLQEIVINMWDFPPQEAFVYYSKNGNQMLLQEITKITEDTYKTRNISKSEVTEEMKGCLLNKSAKIIEH